MCTSFGSVGVFILYHIVTDMHKKRKKKLLKAKAEKAYASAAKSQIGFVISLYLIDSLSCRNSHM